MIERAAPGADLEIKADPHILRHATGYARQPRDGHPDLASVSNTVRYTELAAGRFKNLWKD
jgi:hypothetical protein